ncbi:MAG TPA: cysteine desulfurase family protein [Acidimicrobiales bacterium]
MTRSYLDHASTSPLRPEARAAMLAVLDGPVGDPGRIHEEGLTARGTLETARDQVAAFLGARSREVVFTSGATEAISAVAYGAAIRGAHQVVTAVEHSAVRESAAQHGRVTVVGVDGLGRVDPEAVVAAIEPETAVVHVQWANHEVGTTQPVAAVVEACRDRDVMVHVDAAQAAGRLPIDFAGLGADLVTVSGHKLGGPPGTGVLLVRRGLRLPPLLVGGDQERARRAGLEPVALLAGLGAVAELLADPARLAAEAATARRQTDRVLAAAPGFDGVEAYGDPTDRLPHLVCLGVLGIEPQAVLLGLDRAGVAAHSGSACSSESLEPSPVLEAMGLDAHRSLRVSAGWSTTDADIDRLLSALPDVIAHFRALAGSQPS